MHGSHGWIQQGVRLFAVSFCCDICRPCVDVSRHFIMTSTCADVVLSLPMTSVRGRFVTFYYDTRARTFHGILL